MSALTHQLGVSLEDWKSFIDDYNEKGLKLIKGDTEQLTLILTLHSWNHTWDTIVEELAQYHKRYPLREGMDRLQIQKKYFSKITPAQWNVVLREAAQEQRIHVKQKYIAQFNLDPFYAKKMKSIGDSFKIK